MPVYPGAPSVPRLRLDFGSGDVDDGLARARESHGEGQVLVKLLEGRGDRIHRAFGELTAELPRQAGEQSVARLAGEANDVDAFHRPVGKGLPGDNQLALQFGETFGGNLLIEQFQLPVLFLHGPDLAL